MRTNCRFDGQDIENSLKSMGLTKAFVIDLGDTTRFDAIFKKIFQAMKTDKILGSFTASYHVYESLIELCKAIKEQEAPQQYQRRNHLMPVLQYIDENLEKSITLEDLSSIIGVTPQHLCRVFKECLDIRPFEYISRLRIQVAKKYLIDNKVSIAEIANMVGFNNTSYFCLIFKRFEGITPTEFRSLNRH